MHLRVPKNKYLSFSTHPIVHFACLLCKTHNLKILGKKIKVKNFNWKHVFFNLMAGRKSITFHFLGSDFNYEYKNNIMTELKKRQGMTCIL